ncbi:GNAT family N-acetyltransferase [Streptomyces sp. 5-8]|uniref:GNAT family N-acetyltransferase n=1 Tax=Streptomyces musisoli TaxID=2802280 RepID=A0ABS1PB67_9ACTN|nr:MULTISPECIES: GNAT family N-acetyltransferase [Streptomyces]MBL1109610.1 GNAT family N-acetyltransferase [Streptomyces musisoli]MBY8842231.1 GNAT family N-acetyltransferase [Streptomyces sp. SP2-10]
METTAQDPTVPPEPGTVAYRPARPEDGAAIAALDGSFTTDSVFEVTATQEGFRIRETPVRPPLHKVFPAGDDEADGDGDFGGSGPSRTVVAVDGDELCGFVTASFEPWNARLTVRDIEVAPAWRNKGVGRALMSHAVNFAKEHRAEHVWLEVSNVNAPAVHAYLRMGFAFCGLDTSLYDGTESAGERALFMARPVP